MHGVGLRHSSHAVDGSGEQVFEGGCTKAVLLAKKELDAYVPTPSNMVELKKTFGNGVEGRVSESFFLFLIDIYLSFNCTHIYQHKRIYMYVFMHECMYIYMYVRTYVCMYVCEYVSVYMYVCMYVHTYYYYFFDYYYEYNNNNNNNNNNNYHYYHYCCYYYYYHDYYY